MRNTHLAAASQNTQAIRRLWITGGGQGIGRAVALEYAARGWTVAISARTPSDLQAVADEAAARQFPGLIVPFVADVTDQDALKIVFKTIEHDLGPLDQVILNAGTHMPSPAREFNVAPFRVLMEINFMGVVNGLSAVVPTFTARRSGHIGIVSSLAGYGGLPLASAYGASKAALINMCEALKPELDAVGVKLSLINPGFVRTPLTDKNTFPMPFLIGADVAAHHIYDGMAAGRFEIAFPRAFVLIMKFLRILPYRLYFAVVRNITGV